MAVDDIQNSERLLDLSKQILDSLNQRAASQQKLNSDEKAYAAALEKAQKISNAVVSNQIKSKDLTKVITRAEENLGQIRQKYSSIEKTAYEDRKNALLESRKLRQQERDTTQEITELTQQNLRLELDRQNLLQETTGLNFAQIQANQELASQLETQISSNQELIAAKSTLLDLTRQSIQTTESVAEANKNIIKSGREIIGLTKQEIKNLYIAQHIYETTEDISKRIEASEKSREGIQDKLINNQNRLNDVADNFQQILQKSIDSKTKFNELTQQNISFEKILNNTEKLAYNAKKTSLFELKKLHQDVRDLQKEKQAISNTPENQKILDNLDQKISLLKQEITSHEDIVTLSKSIIKNNQSILFQNEDILYDLKERVAKEKEVNSLTKDTAKLTNQQLQLQDNIQDKVDQQLTYKEKDKILTQGIFELQANQDKAKQIADASQLQSSAKIESLTKSITELDNKRVAINTEIAKLNFEAYKLEQAITAEKAKQDADPKTISNLQKKIDANNKLIANKTKEKDLVDDELISLNNSKRAAENLATTVNNANQANLDKLKLITEELKKQTVIGDYGIQNNTNLLGKINDVLDSVDKRKLIIGGVSEIEQTIYDILTEQKSISTDILNNQQKYKENQIGSKKLSENIAAAQGTILANIKSVTVAEKELAQQKQEASILINDSKQKQQDLEQNILDLNQTQFALEGTRQGQLRLGNISLADQVQQTIDLNKATIQNYQDEISKLGDVIKTREDLIVSIGNTETSLKGVIDGYEKELEFLQKNLKVKQQQEKADEIRAKELQNQTANIAAIQYSEKLLSLSNDSIDSLNQRKKILKGISAEEQLYFAAVRRQQSLSQDITSNAEKYLGYTGKSKELKKQQIALQADQKKFEISFGNIEKKLAEQRKKYTVDARNTNTALLKQKQELIASEQRRAQLEARQQLAFREGNEPLAEELQRRIEDEKDTARVKLNQIESLKKQLDKEIKLRDSTRETLKNGQKILKSQKDELEVLKKGLETRKRIEKSTGLLGGLTKAASKIPGIGQYLNADEANEEMQKLAAEIEKSGGKATSFGNRIKIAGKGLEVLAKGAYENLKSPEAVFTFLLKSALTANDQAVKLGKSLGYAGARADAYRETLVGIERSSKNINVNTANLAEAFGELSKFTGFAYEFTADQLETQIKLTKQVGLTAEEAAQVQRFAVLNGKTSEETYRSFVKGLTATRNQLRVGIDFKAALAEAVKVSGQLAANLGNNPEIIAKAIITAQALGMTLDQVSKAGETLLNFESSIENELKAELLTGKELNLERARAAALAGDQVALAEELAKNIGSAAEFTKMNRLQQNALAQAVGMTADELANTLRKREEALASGKSLAQINEEEVAQALERQSIQDKFNAAMLKLQSVIGNLLAGPLGSFLDMLSGALNIVNELGKALSFLATPLKVIASLYLGIKAAQLVINAGKAIELGLSAKQMVLEEGKFSLSTLSHILQKESFGVRLSAYALSLKDIVLEKLKVIFSKSTYTALLAQISRFPTLLAFKSMEATLSTETAIASTATASAMSFGTAAIAIIAGIAAVAAAMYALKDGVIDPQKGPVISGEFGTVKLDKNDKAMYGADGKIKVGTDLLGTEDKGIQSSVLKNTTRTPQAFIEYTFDKLTQSVDKLRQDTVRTNNEIKEATLASANKPALIVGKNAFIKDINKETFIEANKTNYKVI